LINALGSAKPTADKDGTIIRPIPRTTLWVKPFTASGYQYWEPDRGRMLASLVRSHLAGTGRFAVMDSVAWLKEDSKQQAAGVVSTARYEIRGEIIRLGARHRLVISAVEPVDGGSGEIVRSWRDEVGSLQLLGRAAERLAERMAAEFPLRHIIVRVEGDEVDIELGTIDGLTEGRELDVYRRLEEVRHPYTGAGIEWRLSRLGKIKVVWVGRRLSRAKIEEEKYIGVIQPGDWIE
jgi:hypothetical protein